MAEGGKAASRSAGNSVDEPSAKRVQKADRERLRRDRLNEQFIELAGVLDASRPKHDKATVLGDALAMVCELREAISRMKGENGALHLEARELSSEKADLRRDKAVLKAEVDALQSQVAGRMAAAFAVPWFPGAPYPVNAATSAPPFPPHPQPFPAFAAIGPPPPPVMPEPATPLPAWLGQALQEREQARRRQAAAAAAAATAAAATTAATAAAQLVERVQAAERPEQDAGRVMRPQDGNAPPLNAAMMAMPVARLEESPLGRGAEASSGVFASGGVALPGQQDAVADRIGGGGGQARAHALALPSGAVPSNALPGSSIPEHAISMPMHAQQGGSVAGDSMGAMRDGGCESLKCDDGVANAQRFDQESAVPWQPLTLPENGEGIETRAIGCVGVDSRPLDGDAET